MLPIALSFALVGALIAARRRENPIGWLYIVFGRGRLPRTSSLSYASRLVRAGSLPGANVAASSAGRTLAPVLRLPRSSACCCSRAGELLVAALALGRARRRRDVRGARAHRHVRVGVLAQRCPTCLLARRSFDGPVDGAWPGDLPDGCCSSTSRCSSSRRALARSLRLRRSHGEERQQVKWFVYTVLFVMVVFPVEHRRARPRRCGVVLFPLIPISAAIAILRHRLYDIDVVVNAHAGLRRADGDARRARTWRASCCCSCVLSPTSTWRSPAPRSPSRRSSGRCATRIQALVDRRFYRAQVRRAAHDRGLRRAAAQRGLARGVERRAARGRRARPCSPPT